MLLHVAIVSDQFLPTVIPTLMHRPRLVVLVASQPMAAKAERLRRMLEAEGCAVDVREKAPDAGLDCIRAYAARLAEDLTTRWPGAEWVFNATGGNKLMTLGFVEVFRERADRIIYTDTAHGRIEVIADRHTEATQPEPMRDMLDVPRYLAVQGFRYQRDAAQEPGRLARVDSRRDVAAHLAQQASRLSGLIALVNGLVQAALDDKGRELVHPVQHLKEELRGEWRTAFEHFARASLVQWVGNRGVRFPDVESARFLGGGWLEEYAFVVAREAGLYDVRMGVTGVWEGAASARNEFDVLACHRNRMLFIECKTLRFQGDENDNDLAYKVKSLSDDARGLLGDTWVLAAQEPSPILRDRAKQAGFQMIGPKHLRTLAGWLNLWKQGQS
ncbi:MAG: DUF1887 family protein [Nitrospira sp.]|nr:DUF1887 family protein [Nitrospira sp.]